MMGFAGAGPELGIVERMAAAICHRGPDGEGFFADGRVVFGHRRLAIIDIAGSPQPMTSADGNFTMVFNGEILNYRQLRRELDVDWRTEGDTEVLLELIARQGVDGLQRLRGQFSFAVYDHRDGSVLFARDRLGILPLFYAIDADGLAFASEVKALRCALPALTLDQPELPAYLSQRAVPAPATLFEGVKKVLPGSWMRVQRDGRVDSGRYWSLRSRRAILELSPAAAVDELERLLASALEEALVADVPVGAYLSGGVDSTVTVALAVRAAKAKHLATFSAAFPGSDDDESPYARRVSAILGTDHHEVEVDPHSFFDELWRLSWYRDAPISETSDVAIAALAKAASQHVKVVISGEGSDELFGGYPKYRFARAGHLVGLVPTPLRKPAAQLAARAVAGHRPRIGSALRAMQGHRELDRLRGWFSPYSPDEVRRLCGRLPSDDQPSLTGDPVQRMGIVDLGSWLSDNLLERGDRMTMASSIELRPPFLDPRVVEFALSLPSSIKLHNKTLKWPVKELAKRFVSADIVDRPKVGFRVPVSEWFRTHLSSSVRELLQSDASRCRQWLDATTIDSLVNDHLSGKADRGKQLWPLVSLEVWARTVLEQGVPASTRE
jgi:asparagine synthase (glutamine-hydrolysing)